LAFATPKFQILNRLLKKLSGVCRHEKRGRCMNGDFTIRLMRADDYAAVMRLWQNSEGICLREADDSAEGIRRFLARNPRSCFVAQAQFPPDRIAGCILCGHDGRRANIYHAAVAKEFQRRGIGRALVSAAEQAMREAGIGKIALAALNTNETGNRFWEKAGYTRRDDLGYRNKCLSG
jgi:ribosomal protein S18 acetylase RimI-like enzyme